MEQIALYARVSSERQAQDNTIESQIAALETRIDADGYILSDNLKFIDNGYSGSNLIRPALEKLRDKVADGEIDKIYIHSPDRLSRKYAYQIIILEEFQKAGAEIVFLNFHNDDTPESQLLLQMQGMISEYERTKIIERNRRGKIHAAKKGSVNVLGGCCPYGYDYIDSHSGGGQAQYVINEQEASVVRKIFSWIAYDRLSLRKVRLNLYNMNIPSPTGDGHWTGGTLNKMLRNPTYIGRAAFGKTKVGARRPQIRPQKNFSSGSRSHYSVYMTDKKDWIYIPVPAIIEEDLFEIVQEQLDENRKRTRTIKRGELYLLQGLVVCNHCNYSYCARAARTSIQAGRQKVHHSCYRCNGTDSYRFGGTKICNNKPVRVDALDIAVWEEVKILLNEPNRLLSEYRRRIDEIDKTPENQSIELLEKQENKVKRGISRLIDSYTQEQISKEEFEPRIKSMKQNLTMIEEHKKKLTDRKELKKELSLIVTNVEDFASKIKSGLETADWHAKRDIIRTLVKRIEINNEEINVVFRVKELSPIKNESMIGHNGAQYCHRGNKALQCSTDGHKLATGLSYSFWLKFQSNSSITHQNVRCITFSS